MRKLTKNEIEKSNRIAKTIADTLAGGKNHIFKYANQKAISNWNKNCESYGLKKRKWDEVIALKDLNMKDLQKSVCEGVMKCYAKGLFEAESPKKQKIDKIESDIKTYKDIYMPIEKSE